MDGSDGEESALGTHQHWQSTYERELAGLRERGDPGEVWFGSRVAQAMVAFILGLLPAPGACAVLDVGTGNGLLALQLTAAGCRRVTGSDYCQASIELALALAAQRGDTTTRWVLDDVLHTRLQPGCAGCAPGAWARHSSALLGVVPRTLLCASPLPASSCAALGAVGLCACQLHPACARAAGTWWRTRARWMRSA